MLSEVQHSVDDVVIISRGQLRHQSSMEGLAALSVPRVRVASPDVDKLAGIAQSQGWTIVQSHPASSERPGVLDLEGVGLAAVGEAAFVAGVMVQELTDLTESLEDVFLRLTEGMN